MDPHPNPPLDFQVTQASNYSNFRGILIDFCYFQQKAAGRLGLTVTGFTLGTSSAHSLQMSFL